ncbi:hypothetical protein PT273_05140 [Orbaceae bacterium ESL0727]|nr:hypothetical protein [Orbaceae bacterium ESL0727]
MEEFKFNHNKNGSITALRLKNNRYVELLTFGLQDIPRLLTDFTQHLPPEVRRYMENIRG